MKQSLSKASETNPAPIQPANQVGGDTPVEFRHIEAFRQFYRENGQREPWIRSKTSRSSVATALKRIEAAFGSELFEERKDGELFPSPFGQRLFNDTAGVESAMSRLMESVSKIRENRLLRVGASQVLFRTCIFRRIFRLLGEMDAFRISYVAVSEEDSCSALTQGRCDLYFGFGAFGGDRFISQKVAEVPMRTYVRRSSDSSMEDPAQLLYPKSVPPPSDRPERMGKSAAPVSEDTWNRWLDHPAECEAGVVVEALEVVADPRFWKQLPASVDGSAGRSLSAIHLRSHPYEFLMPLGGKLKQRLGNNGEA